MLQNRGSFFLPISLSPWTKLTSLLKESITLLESSGSINSWYCQDNTLLQVMDFVWPLICNLLKLNNIMMPVMLSLSYQVLIAKLSCLEKLKSNWGTSWTEKLMGTQKVHSNWIIFVDKDAKCFQKLIRRRRASNLIVHLKKEDDMCINDTEGVFGLPWCYITL